MTTNKKELFSARLHRLCTIKCNALKKHHKAGLNLAEARPYNAFVRTLGTFDEPWHGNGAWLNDNVRDFMAEGWYLSKTDAGFESNVDRYGKAESHLNAPVTAGKKVKAVYEECVKALDEAATEAESKALIASAVEQLNAVA